MSKGYILADGSYSSEYSVGDKFVVVDVEGREPHYCFNDGTIITFTEEDNSDCPYFDDGDAVNWRRLKAYKEIQQFTKTSLKDGMVVEYRNGWKRIVFEYKLLSDEGVGSELGYFNEDLTYSDEWAMDIVKVMFGGELLWQREEDPTPAQLKKQRITKELEFAEAKRERLNAHIERLKANLAD